jgi:NADH dehydrogenase FAD-containing subunit
MKTGSGKPNVIVLGAGAAGIAMAHQLRYGLGFDNFMVSKYSLSKKIYLSISVLNADPYHRYMRRTLESEAHGFKTPILDGNFRLQVRWRVSN